MASRVCWKCGYKSHMTRRGDGLHVESSSENGWVSAGLYTCDHCHWPSLGIGNDDPRYIDHHVRQWLPEAPSGKDFPDVPAHIAPAADEAHRCRSIGAYRGATILARAVVEATCKDKGAKGSTLAARIEALQGSDLVRRHTAQVAHEVRHMGNDMAHGDFVEAIEAEEADEILQLMDEVLDEVYGSPARLARRQAAREAKKGQMNEARASK